MPVQRFRSAEEMNAAPAPVRVGGAFERFVRHCVRYRMLCPRTYPQGVFRFRSIEEAQRYREKTTGVATDRPA